MFRITNFSSILPAGCLDINVATKKIRFDVKCRSIVFFRKVAMSEPASSERLISLNLVINVIIIASLRWFARDAVDFANDSWNSCENPGRNPSQNLIWEFGPVGTFVNNANPKGEIALWTVMRLDKVC